MEKALESFIESALREDAPEGDITSQACIPSDAACAAHLLVKEPCVVAGMEVARRILQSVDPQADFSAKVKDGDECRAGDIAFQVRCGTRSLLRAERVLLNTMQRMSGIATLSRQFASAVEGLPVRLLDTRKTTPLIRFLEKWAVRIGGCENYRDSLSDWFMIKDNHVKACGGVDLAIRQVVAYRRANGCNKGITVEVKNLAELRLVLSVGQVDRIMLDNFPVPLLTEAVAVVNGRFQTEASGGVTLEKVRTIARTGVDFISVGALTHSAQSVDLSLKIF
ncbi:MAG: hypothetical protein RLY31_3221 [Bacteroidota bacterium]